MFRIETIDLTYNLYIDKRLLLALFFLQSFFVLGINFLPILSNGLISVNKS